jgi:hypothetical protein
MMRITDQNMQHELTGLIQFIVVDGRGHGDNTWYIFRPLELMEVG